MGSALGIYFGPKLISIVETKGRKMIKADSILQSTISTSELEEKLPPEAKITEIIALFKDELRRKKIEAKQATLCLSGKDLIIRTFDIPVLPKQELQAAINFEAKKYIPFKVEELISDFQLKFNKTSHSNSVLFMGVKKETLDRYIAILSQLNIKLNAIEYSGFSVLRCMRLSGVSGSGLIGILGTDLKGEDEVNFTVLEQGFPLFSRDISLVGGPEDLGKIQESEPAIALEKLKKEIKVSLDYWHRKFPNKDIKKIYLFSGSDFQAEIGAHIKEIGLSAQTINTAKYLDRSMPYSLSFIKAYSAALYNTVRTSLTLNLLSAKEKTRVVKQKPEKSEILSLLKTLNLDYRILVLALLICLASYGLGLYKLQPLRQELSNSIEIQSKFSGINSEASYEELTNKNSEYKGKLDILENLLKKQLYVTESLRLLPRVMPPELWLTRLLFRRTDQKKAQIDLEGYVYLGDSNMEFEIVNKLVSNLRNHPEFTKYFTEIGINSLDRRQIEKFLATAFTITCKTYKE
jgi:hypothetical protein